MHTIETSVSEIIECKNHFVPQYNSCDTIADRYFSLDELYCEAGEWARPVEDTDWNYVCIGDSAFVLVY